MTAPSLSIATKKTPCGVENFFHQSWVCKMRGQKLLVWVCFYPRKVWRDLAVQWHMVLHLISYTSLLLSKEICRFLTLHSACGAMFFFCEICIYEDAVCLWGGVFFVWKMSWWGYMLVTTVEWRREILNLLSPYCVWIKIVRGVIRLTCCPWRISIY